jgi:hypothetical protein
MDANAHERMDMTFEERIRFEVEDFLLGPNLADRIYAIEPDAGLRMLKQATCQHEDWDHSYELCRFCGITRQSLIEERYNG